MMPCVPQSQDCEPHSLSAADSVTEKGHDFVTRNLSGNEMIVSITRKYQSIYSIYYF